MDCGIGRIAVWAVGDPGIGEALGQVMNPALAPIQALLGTPEGATIAWVHFLTFYLFVGADRKDAMS